MTSVFFEIMYEDRELPWTVFLAVVAGVILTIWLLAKWDRAVAKTLAITLVVLALVSQVASMVLSTLVG